MINKKVWDYLAWMCLAGIALWLILKVLGVINTPIWLEYSPLFGAVYLAGWAMSRLDILKEDVSILKTDVKILKEDVGILKNDVGALKNETKTVQFDIKNIKLGCKICKN